MKVLSALSLLITPVLRFCRFFSWVAMALMVVIIIVQVIYRYLPWFDALSWTEEAARFLMLWSAALIAPSAYRWSGFVAIEMLPRVLPKFFSMLLTLLLLAASLVVLLVGIKFGIKHVNSGWLFNSSSLKIPMQLIGKNPVPVKLGWMYLSLLVGLVLLTVVNIELLIRSLYSLFNSDAELPHDKDRIMAGAD